MVPSTTPLLQILVGLGGLGLGQSAMALETVPTSPTNSLALCPSATKFCAVAPTKAPPAMAFSPTDCQENCQADAQLDTVGWALPTLDPELAQQPSPQLSPAIALAPETVALDTVGWALPTLDSKPAQPLPQLPQAIALAPETVALDTVGWALPTLDSKPAQPSPQIPQAIASPPPTTLALDPEAMVEDLPQGAIAPTLDLDPAVIEGSPTLQRWLERIPDVADDIRHQPSFRSRLRAGYAQFPSTAGAGGFGAAIEDVFVVPGTGLTASADYSRSWNGQREAYGGEARYYLLPLGGYVNIAPTVGYRSLNTPAYQTDGLDVGLRLMLVPSRGGGADLALSQRWVAPGSEGEVGITSLAIGYAVTRQLRLGTDFQLQNSRFGQDSRFGLSLELLL